VNAYFKNIGKGIWGRGIKSKTDYSAIYPFALNSSAYHLFCPCHYCLRDAQTMAILLSRERLSPIK
jgi:hypothetical protein